MNSNKNAGSCQTEVVFSVYVIWCNKTNMHYVGVTSQQPAYKRIREHKRGKKQFVDKEIKSIGGWEGNCDWWIVEENVPSNLISACEQKWVAFFDCVYPKGYNKTCGGISKIVMSDDAREKLRQKALARDVSGERNPMYGRHHTDEAKAAISAKLSGENSPMYGKSPTNKGVPWTDEQKANLSAKRMGANNSFFGKHHTDETKEKIRQAKLGKPGNRKGAHHTEETKAILREKALARHAAKRAAQAANVQDTAAQIMP